MALSVLADVALDSYKEARLVSAKNYVTDVMHAYTELPLGSFHLKDVFADKMGYSSFFMDASVHNINVYRNKLEKFRLNVEMNVIATDDNTGNASPKNLALLLSKQEKSMASFFLNYAHKTVKQFSSMFADLEVEFSGLKASIFFANYQTR